MSVVRSMMLSVLTLSQGVWLALAIAQPVPVGPEFQVNSYTTSVQTEPAVAVDNAGNFVAVWRSFGSAGSDASGSSIQGQRYDATGTPLGAQFQVNTYTTNEQSEPAVDVDSAGTFVVVWRSTGSAGTDAAADSIQGRRYDGNGTPLGTQFQVNTYTTNSQGLPSVAIDDAGNFVVAWASRGSAGSDSSGDSVQAQRYDTAGNGVGGEFQVNTYTSFLQKNPKVAADNAGNFVVVWESYGSAGSDVSDFSIQGRRYDAAGNPLGGEFQVNTYTTSNQYAPAVDIDAAGRFVVVWHSWQDSEDTSSLSVQGQRYDAAGAPLGAQFLVNTYTTYGQLNPDVAVDDAGTFVVVWTAAEEDGTIQGQRFDSAGSPVGSQFLVSTYGTSNQVNAKVEHDDLGRFVVAWQSSGSSGSDSDGYSVQAQRFVVPTTSSTLTSTSTSTTLAPLQTELLPGRIGIIKPATLAKFVAKPSTGDTFALPTANPIAVGGSLRIFDVATTAGDDTYNLHAGAAWKGLGNPAGSKGYKYKGAGTPADPCKVVLVKGNVIKGVCRGTGITLVPPFTGDMGIVLSIGMTDRYCAQFGGDEVNNDPTLTKRKDAQAPPACP
jgi:hypothetical protein